MTLRLNDEETEALRRKASDEGRSMQEVARTAINRYTRDEDLQFRALVQTVVERDRELLDRLGDISPSAGKGRHEALLQEDSPHGEIAPVARVRLGGDETVTDQPAR